MDSSTSSQHTSEQKLSINDAQLTRVHRALGLVDRSRFVAEFGSYQRKWHPLDEYDARRTSRYAFEGDVFLLAMSIGIRRNDVGKTMQVNVDVATLDTRDLARLGTGSDAKFWMEEIQKNTIYGRNRKPLELGFGLEEVVEGEPLTDASFGRLRRDVAKCFEEAPPKPFLSESSMKPADGQSKQKLAQGDSTGVSKGPPDAQPKRRIVVVSYNAQRLRDVLAECVGFHLEEHPSVVDIVDIANIVPVYTYRTEGYQNRYNGKAATTPAFDQILSWEEMLSKLQSPRPTGATSSAQYCLSVLISCAVKDIEQKNHPLSLPGGDGGDFPGPYRKAESFAASNAPDVAGVAAPSFKISLKNKTKPAGPGSLGKPPQKGPKTAPMMPDDDDELADITARVASGLSIGARPYRSQPGPKASASSSRNVQTGQSADVLDYESDVFAPAAPGGSGVLSTTAMPEQIGQKHRAYKIAAERFVSQLCKAASRFCDIESYARQQTNNGRSVWTISSPDNYVELAKILVKSGEVAAREVNGMLVELDKEITGRNDVDQWYQGLPKNDVKRTGTAGHSAFTETLKKTRDILRGFSADGSI